MELVWIYVIGIIASALAVFIGSTINYETLLKAKEDNSSLKQISNPNILAENILNRDAGLIIKPMQSALGITGGVKTGIAIRDIVDHTATASSTIKAVWFPPDVSTAVKSVLDQCGLYIVQNEERVIADITEKVLNTRAYQNIISSGAIEDESTFYMSLNSAQAYTNAFSELGYFDDNMAVIPGVTAGYLINPSEQAPEVCSFNDVYLQIKSDLQNTGLFKQYFSNVNVPFQELFNVAKGDTNYTVTNLSSYPGAYSLTPSLAQPPETYDTRCKWLGAVATFYEGRFIVESEEAYHTGEFGYIGHIVRDTSAIAQASGSSLLSRYSGIKDVDWKDPGYKIPTREEHDLITIFPNIGIKDLPGVLGDTFPAVRHIAIPLSIPNTIDEALENIRALSWSGVRSIATDEPIPDLPSPTPPYIPDPPSPPAPNVSANKLFTVHTIDDSNINALGGYLWSSTFTALIEHMFTEPINAVLGLHELHYGGSIPTGGSESIKLGSITSPASGNKVTNRYMSFSCGSVDIPEYYNNVNDYKGYTSASIFLPYCGVYDIDVNQIMGKKVSVTYGIDVYTGSCIARLYTNNGGTEIGNYYGQCGCQLPVTSGDYTSMITGAIKGAVAGGITGGLAGGIFGALGGASSGSIQYSRSNGFNNNVSPMGRQKPLILLQRPNSYEASSRSKYYGLPTNITVTLGTMNGYTRIKNVHLDSIKCTDGERIEIDRLLKEGVIF